jgi:lysophospholipase L1-like esterase
MGLKAVSGGVSFTTDASGNITGLANSGAPYLQGLFTGVTGFEIRGDSFITGLGITDSTQWIGAQLATAVSLTQTNDGFAGSGILGHGYTAFIFSGASSLANTSNRLNFLLTGLNDMRAGNTTARLDAFAGILATTVAIVASKLSAVRQFYNGGGGGVVFGAPANSFTHAITSVGISGYGQNGYWRGLRGNTNGDTITSIVQGDVVYIVYDRIKTLTGGTFSVSIDGAVVIPSVSCDGTGLSITAGEAITADSTATGYPTLLRIPTTPGRHTVLITTTSATNASNVVQVECVMGNEDMVGPTVVVGGCCRMNAAGYAGSPAAYGSVAIGDAAAAAYTAVIKQVCDMLYGDGLNVHFANTAAYDPVTTTTQVQADNIHPSATGATALAGALQSGLNIRTIRQRREYKTPTFAPTVGASPYTYTNNTPQDVDAFVTGGTTTVIAFSRDGTNFTTLGTTTPGQMQLSPGDAVRVTYAVAPTVTIVPR